MTSDINLCHGQAMFTLTVWKGAKSLRILWKLITDKTTEPKTKVESDLSRVHFHHKLSTKCFWKARVLNVVTLQLPLGQNYPWCHIKHMLQNLFAPDCLPCEHSKTKALNLMFCFFCALSVFLGLMRFQRIHKSVYISWALMHSHFLAANN